MGEADILQNYDEKFMQALSRLKDLGEAKQTGDAYREGLVTRPKSIMFELGLNLPKEPIVEVLTTENRWFYRGRNSRQVLKKNYRCFRQRTS